MASSAKSPNFLTRLVKGSGSKPPDEAQAAHTRRREQVRRAQRTHRERKEKYVRNLELEVAKLREQDAAHSQEVANFKQKIRHLQDLLTSNGIAVPAHLLLSQTPSPQASIAVVNHPDGSQGIHATMPIMHGFEEVYMQQQSPNSPMYHTATATSSSEPGIYQPTMTSTSDQTSSATSHAATLNLESTQNPSVTSQLPDVLCAGPQSQPKAGIGGYHPNGLDAAQIAVDFVLALESPCLHHHHPDDPNGSSEEASGHALMLQSPIMNHCPSPTLSHDATNTQRYPSDMTWTVPARAIENLLNLSARLSLDGEITPIEAWQRIKRHPSFLLMDANRLDALKATLMGEVRCYGFGAVLDEDYFEMILQQAFAQLVS